MGSEMADPDSSRDMGIILKWREPVLVIVCETTLCPNLF